MLEGTAFFSARPNLRAPAAQTFTIRRASVLPTLSELIHEYYYYILRCATHILTCPSASVCSWQRNCRFGIGAAAWQACSRVRSCTPSADQCAVCENSAERGPAGSEFEARHVLGIAAFLPGSALSDGTSSCFPLSLSRSARRPCKPRARCDREIIVLPASKTNDFDTSPCRCAF